MPTLTTNFSFAKPDPGQTNWAGTMNATLDAIDAAIGSGGKEHVTAYSATPTFNFGLGSTQVMTLTGNVTSSAVSNPAPGLYTFVIIQDATGGRTFTFPASFRGAGTISDAAGTAAANSVAIQTFAYVGAISAYVAITPLIFGD